MNVQEIESLFNEIDERSKINSINVTLEGNTESTGRLNINLKENENIDFSYDGVNILIPQINNNDITTYSPNSPGLVVPDYDSPNLTTPNYDSSSLTRGNYISTETDSKNLLAINLNEIDIPEDYIQEKNIDIFTNVSKFGELPGPVLTPLGASGLWRLLKDYTYITKCSFDTGTTSGLQDCSITVSAPFIYDRASVPRIFWVIIGKDDLAAVPALFHDYLYKYGGVLSSNQVKPYRIFSREEVDDLFYELMLKSGVSSWRCYLAYQAVRKFADFAWKLNNTEFN